MYFISSPLVIAGAFRQGTPNGYSSTNNINNSGSGGGGVGVGINNLRDTSSPLNHSDSDYKYGRFDVSALHIAHALKQTEVQKAYNKAREKPIDHYLVSKEFTKGEQQQEEEEED